MALKQNGVLLNQMPLRFRGADLGAYRQFGRTRLWWLSENPEEKKSGFPTGNLAPASGFLPLQAGGMNGRNSAALAIVPIGSGAMGVNGSATASLSINFANASGNLIVSGAGTATFTITTTANVVAALFGVGSASLSIDPSASIVAKAWGIASGTFSITGSITPYARGNMIGSTDVASVITNDSVASAVWAAIASANNASGTMGNKLNSAASGGVDYNALAAAILAAAEAAPIASNIKEVNSVPVDGAGTEADPFGPV